MSDEFGFFIEYNDTLIEMMEYYKNKLNLSNEQISEITELDITTIEEFEDGNVRNLEELTKVAFIFSTSVPI